ncbi:MAG: hypothetical protein ACI4R8_03410 [Candidatus Caccovivens sp.]
MKKFGKMLCAILSVAFLVTGCATVGSIKNDYSEVIYNGNSACLVSDHLYFGNSFADYTTFGDDNGYKSATSVSYLSRIDINNINAKTEDYSPKTVEKVTDEVVAQAKSFTFVLGDYIYYATPNRQKFADSDGKSDFYFNYSTIYRSKLNGDNKEKLYTTNGEVTNIEVLKFDGKYYVVMLAGENLVKMEVGSKVKTTVVASGVASLAIPKTYQKDKVGSTLDWNGQIYYTTTKSDESNPDLKGSYVNKVSVSGGDVKSYFVGQNKTLTFIGRERDVMFYTLSGTTTEVFKFDSNAVTGQPSFGNDEDRFYSASTLSNITLITAPEGTVRGYAFLNSSNTIGYVTNAGKQGSITLKNGTETLSSYKLLLISGQTAILSTTSGIYKADLSTAFNGNGGAVEVACIEIVTMTAIYDGTLYAFDGTYIYYYAKLETVDTDEDDDTTDEDSDDTYYLYRARVGIPNGYQLLSLTKYDSRHTKG